MIGNIVDRRKRRRRFKVVNAIIEPTRHDNSVKGGDRAPRNTKMDKRWIGYDEREKISVNDAIRWAWSHADFVTLYLYDKGDGISSRRKQRVRKVN